MANLRAPLASANRRGDAGAAQAALEREHLAADEFVLSEWVQFRTKVGLPTGKTHYAWGGATTAGFTRVGSRILLFSAGDSRSIAAPRLASEDILVTPAHTPALDGERARITAAGLTVSGGRMVLRRPDGSEVSQVT